MKARTKFEKEVEKLSKGLPLTEKQKQYAYQHCFNHYARRTKGGIVTCTECGHTWHSDHSLAESVCGCTCPQCGQELEILETRKRVFKAAEYYSLITTKGGYQILRFFLVRGEWRVGQAARYSIIEVVQRWIAPNGRSVTVARSRCMSNLYYDLWNEWSDLEIRKNQHHRSYGIIPSRTYPVKRFMMEVKRNGFTGENYGIPLFDLFKAILSDSMKETLLKAGQIAMLKRSVRYEFDLQRYWDEIKICIRNKYCITDVSVWCDYVDLLRYFEKDTHNAKYLCPQNLLAEHDRLADKRQEEQWRKEREENQRRAFENEARFTELKGRFFGLNFTDGTISVHVLESVADYLDEGNAMHHCVFVNEYYLKEDSLVLSATVAGCRVETVEISLQNMKVIQSRGKYNRSTEYHDRIIKLVESNAGLIRKRMAA